MKLIYKTKEIAGTSQNYNDLANKPKLNSVELVGDLTSNDINIYDKDAIDALLASGRSVKQVTVLPTPTVKNTMYYVGPDSEDLYDVYLFDNDNNAIYLGKSNYTTYLPGYGITINASNQISVDPIKVVRPDTTGSTPVGMKIWTGTRAEYNKLSSEGRLDNLTLYNVEETSTGLKEQEIYDIIYPVNSTYIGFNAPILPFGVTATWSLLSNYDNRSIWIDSTKTVGSKIDGSLPNITGTVGYFKSTGATGVPQFGTGAFIKDTTYGKNPGEMSGDNTSSLDDWNGYIDFDASRSSSVYSNVTGLVRPTSIVVHVWKRTA